MIEIIFGFILFFLPFILIFCFKDKILGFVSLTTGSLVFHTVVAFITQYFNLFTYKNIVFINIILCVVVIFVFWKEKKYFFKLDQRKNIKTILLSLFAIFIISFELLSVHFLYSGIVTTSNGLTLEEKSYLPFPYFSDEWVSVAFINYSIENQTISFTNPFNNKSYLNVTVLFFSLLSVITLIFHVPVLYFYSVMSLFFGLLICFLIYLYLRSEKISVYSSIFAALATALILNSSNLPGIWNLIPYIGSFTFFLLSLIAYNLKRKDLFFIAQFFSLILYLPMVIFVVPAIIGSLNVSFLKNNIKKVTIFFAGILIIGVISYLLASFKIEKINIFQLARDFFMRDNLVDGIYSFPLWKIVPIFVLPFSLFGIISFYLKKRYTMLNPLFVGLIFWVIYCFTENVFIIDYPRVVSITSFFIIVCSGFGFEFFINKLSNTYYHKYIQIIKILFLILFAISAIKYTSNNWMDLILNNKDKPVVFPSPPVTRYLIEEDLKLFSGIKNKVFISDSWKGLVIGAATGNLPLHTKASTISNNAFKYSDFMEGDCVYKNNVSSKYKIEYVFSSKINCEGFREIGSTSEGFYLYEIVPNNI